MSTSPLRHLAFPAFVALYLLFDWATYIDPLYGLNITPWNPDPALGLVFWLRYGWRAAGPWFVALCAGEMLVRGMPAGQAIVRPWGERSFYVEDPWGNPLCFVDRGTIYAG